MSPVEPSARLAFDPQELSGLVLLQTRSYEWGARNHEAPSLVQRGENATQLCNLLVLGTTLRERVKARWAPLKKKA